MLFGRVSLYPLLFVVSIRHDLTTHAGKEDEDSNGSVHHLLRAEYAHTHPDRPLFTSEQAQTLSHTGRLGTAVLRSFDTAIASRPSPLIPSCHVRAIFVVPAHQAMGAEIDLPWKGNDSTINCF